MTVRINRVTQRRIYITKRERRDAQAIRNVLTRPQHERFLIDKTLSLLERESVHTKRQAILHALIRELYAAQRS